MATSCGPTVKMPEAKKSTMRPAITTRTTRKLLFSASDKACVLESSIGASGGGTGASPGPWE